MAKYRKQFLIGLVFVFFVFVAILGIFNARDLARQLGEFPLMLFVPIMALKFINWAFRYWEWHYFMGVIGIKVSRDEPSAPGNPPVLSLKDSIIIWAAGLPAAVSPGKLGEILKAILLKTKTGVPVTKSTPVVFAERLVDGIAVITLIVIAGLLLGDHLLKAEDSAYLQAVLVVAMVFVGSLVVVAQSRRIAYWLLGIWKHLPLVGRTHHALRELYDATYEITKFRHLARTVGMGMVGYTCDSLVFYLVLIGVGETPAWTLLLQSIFMLGVSVVVASLTAMPGGAGGRELTVGALLATLTTLGKSETGLVVLLVGFFQIWFGTLCGLILIAIFRKTLFTAKLEAEIQAYEGKNHATEGASA